ncbi:MAG: phage terminase large subunit, partial [Polyangiales bacterium]
DGKIVQIGIEQDPGQAGVFEADAYVRALAGFSIRKVRPTGDKVTRAKPASAQCEARNVKLLRGAWNPTFLAELEAFPDGAHDDQVDSFSGGFSMVAAPPLRIARDIERWLPHMPKTRGSRAGPQRGPLRTTPAPRSRPTSRRW